MKKNQSITNFRDDLQDIFDSVVSLYLYKYLNASVFKKRENLLATTKSDLRIFELTQKFETHNYIYNSLYISVVALLETYLQDKLTTELEKDEKKVEKLILEFNLTRKLTAKDILNGPKVIAQEILTQVIFHNLAKVNALYKIVFSADILHLNKNKRLFDIIKVRHKIVHRAGRIQEKKIFVSQLTLLKDMTLISAWVENIEHFINQSTEKKGFVDYYKRFNIITTKLSKSNIHKLSNETVIDRIMLNLYEPFKKEKNDIRI